MKNLPRGINKAINRAFNIYEPGKIIKISCKWEHSVLKQLFTV